jgi:hypothetical protein
MGLSEAGQMTNLTNDEKAGASAVGVPVAGPLNTETQTKSNRASKQPSENARSTVEFFFAADMKEHNRLSSREIHIDQKGFQAKNKSVEKTVSPDESNLTPIVEQEATEDSSFSEPQVDRRNLGIRDIAKGMFAGEDKN